MSALQASWCEMRKTDRRRFNLSLALTVPEQQKVYEILSAIPSGQRTNAVCRMLLEHQAQSELLDGIRLIIREELQNAAILKENTVQQVGAGDVDTDILGFLLALQNGGEHS